MWRRLWSTPQAAGWDGAGYDVALARYTRLAVLAEDGTRWSAASECRQLEDRFGLNPRSMLQLRWTIADAAEHGVAHLPNRTLAVVPPSTPDRWGPPADPDAEQPEEATNVG